MRWEREEEKTFKKYFSWRTELAAMGSGFGEDWKSISEDTNVIDHHKAPQATPRQEANRDNMECNIPKEVPESNNDGHIKAVSQWRTVTLHPQVQVDAPDANPPNPKLNWRWPAFARQFGGLRMRADGLVVHETCVRIFVWDILTVRLMGFSCLRLDAYLKKRSRMKENGRRKQYAAPSTHPRMLEPFCHTRKSVGIPVGIARAFCHNATVLRPLRNNQPLWLPMIL
ncbi:hypothetical protein I307_02389 [Cryptococcus deuterogattii 99/473]|uniref:Uncharacterized protein n=1 Tax=Cryptococcus deuterogattii Ram5 TaxID=1296110 RepID=A0A0D0USV4_9TREE|nr:hypothetical protein I313_05854 [Cryptococcus deuterogattii Ram5]KIY58141.1 hypothetical protein I307_02389 [Cryptococcus deuterogattii 99/473]